MQGLLLIILPGLVECSHPLAAYIGLNYFDFGVTFNQEKPVTIKAKNGETLKEVKNFKYLGAWTESTAADVAVRKALA